MPVGHPAHPDTIRAPFVPKEQTEEWKAEQQQKEAAHKQKEVARAQKRCLEDIDNFAHLMSRANDIYTNRIEKLLESMNTIKLYALPEREPWTLDRRAIQQHYFFGPFLSPFFEIAY